MAFSKWLQFVSVYWPTVVLIITPIVLLPVPLILDNSPSNMCLYVLLLMSIYWVTEAIPMAITSMLPIVLFPLFGVLDTLTTCQHYMSEATMMFTGGLIIAMALEYSNLHTRVALIIISTIGCSPRKLTMGLFFCNMFMSMWMSNTAAVAIMIPIIYGILQELESQGLCNIYEVVRQPYQAQRKALLTAVYVHPSKTTLCYFLGSAFASSIGGCGTIIGSGPSLILKGIYERMFPMAPQLDFTRWMYFNVPFIILATLCTWVYLQWLYMGMFRPNSPEALANNRAMEIESVAREVIRKKLEELGPMNSHQISVAIVFCLAVLAYLTRKPGFITGWEVLFAKNSVKDTTISLFVVLLYFVLPRNYDFLKFFTARRRSELPTKSAGALITWQFVHDRMEWGLIFLLGGGFALSAGGQATGLNNKIGVYFHTFSGLAKFEMIAAVTTVVQMATEVTSNMTIANIVLPVFAEMAIATKMHPLYLMIPACLSCNFSFLLPVSTPPNAIVVAFLKINTMEMVKAGMGPTIICLLLLWFLFPTWGSVVYPQLSTFPEWLGRSSNISVHVE